MSIPNANGSDHDRTFAIDGVAQSDPEFAQHGVPDPAPAGFKPITPSHGTAGPLVQPFPVNQPADGAAPNAPATQNDGRPNGR